MTNHNITNDELITLVSDIARKHSVDPEVLADHTYDHVAYGTTAKPFTVPVAELVAELTVRVAELNTSYAKASVTSLLDDALAIMTDSMS